MSARIEELFEICYKKNSNIKNLKKNDKIYVYIEVSQYYKNIKFVLENSKLTTAEYILDDSEESSFLAGVNGACELIGKGWEKEAVPVIHKKKSIISSFFSRLFS